MAIAAGGIIMPLTPEARNFGRPLTASGFTELPPGSSYKRGNVAVVAANPGHQHGHTCMFDGTEWVSDFRQRHGLYPGPDYRRDHPAFKVYRHR